MSPIKDPRNKQRKLLYDVLSPFYDFLSSGSEARAIDRAMQCLKLKRGERILEIGCGTGASLVKMAKAVGVEGRVTGLDLSTGMIEQAQKKVKSSLASTAELPCVEIIEADVLDVDLAEASFDVIFMSFTLELFAGEEIKNVLDKVRRSIRSQGRVCVLSLSPPAPGDSASLIFKLYEWAHKHFSTLVDCRPIETQAFLEKAGFEIDRVERGAFLGLPYSIVLAIPENEGIQLN